jgi:hypothetical protein
MAHTDCRKRASSFKTIAVNANIFILIMLCLLMMTTTTAVQINSMN